MEEYLGDGLYASIEGDMIKLRAPRGGHDDEVFLEPAIFLEFCRFVIDHGYGDIMKQVLE